MRASAASSAPSARAASSCSRTSARTAPAASRRARCGRRATGRAAITWATIRRARTTSTGRSTSRTRSWVAARVRISRRRSTTDSPAYWAPGTVSTAAAEIASRVSCSPSSSSSVRASSLSLIARSSTMPPLSPRRWPRGQAHLAPLTGLMCPCYARYAPCRRSGTVGPADRMPLSPGGTTSPVRPVISRTWRTLGMGWLMTSRPPERSSRTSGFDPL